MPEGLEIEREQNINGSMAAYAEQVLISTGRSNWTSRIEDEDEGVLVRQLKAFLGRNGKYSDVSVYILSVFKVYTDEKGNYPAVPQRDDYEFIT